MKAAFSRVDSSRIRGLWKYGKITLRAFFLHGLLFNVEEKPYSALPSVEETVLI